MIEREIHERELSGLQLAGFLRAIGNVDPGATRLWIAFLDRNRVRVRSPDTLQQWTIGPRGGLS